MSLQSTSDISIHALHGEGDRRLCKPLNMPHHFNPRPPRGGRQRTHLCYNIIVTLSIHALHGEGDVCEELLRQYKNNLSIHALHGEGDAAWQCLIDFDIKLSIHALHGEGDSYVYSTGQVAAIFQSTPSTGRATLERLRPCRHAGLSIHALHGEGDTCRPR